MNNLTIYFNEEAREQFYECNKDYYHIFDWVKLVREEPKSEVEE